MTHLRLLIIVTVSVATVAGPALVRVLPAGGMSVEAPQEKPAEQAYRNIQVFKGVPASQLLGVMNYMAGALGVSCNHCHVPNQFAKDDKPTKELARRHILMTRSLNENTFAGQNTINCVTCHRGETRPDTRLTLLPADLPAANRETSPLPPVEEVLERYAKALGGTTRFEELKTLAI